MKEKKDPMILEDFFSFSFSSFPSTVTCASLWPTNGKAGRPMKGTRIDRIETHHTNSDSNPEPIRAHKHSAEQRPSSRQPFIISIRDLGHCQCFTTDSLPRGSPGQYCSGFSVCGTRR